MGCDVTSRGVTHARQDTARRAHGHATPDTAHRTRHTGHRPGRRAPPHWALVISFHAMPDTRSNRTSMDDRRCSISYDICISIISVTAYRREPRPPPGPPPRREVPGWRTTRERAAGVPDARDVRREGTTHTSPVDAIARTDRTPRHASCHKHPTDAAGRTSYAHQRASRDTRIGCCYVLMAPGPIDETKIECDS